MEKQYDLTSNEAHSDLVSLLTRYENELSSKYGHDVVLIAYSKRAMEK